MGFEGLYPAELGALWTLLRFVADMCSFAWATSRPCPWPWTKWLKAPGPRKLDKRPERSCASMLECELWVGVGGAAAEGAVVDGPSSAVEGALGWEAS
jgi:hypothetical protein